MVRYIAGDIGGTNSRLQLFQVKGGKLEDACAAEHEVLIVEKVYPSQKHASLTLILKLFLNEFVKDPKDWPVACCLAVAGPVKNNRCVFTNVNWVIDGAEISQTLKIPHVSIINDFVGIGYGLLALERKDVVPLNDVPITPGAPKACIGAGTGLGETYLTNNGAEYDVWSSEGGHTDFAPRSQLEFEIMSYIKKVERVTRVSVERVVSGLGMPRIYEYLAEKYPEDINQEVLNKYSKADHNRIIQEFAESGKCNLCRRAVDLFVGCYGAEAGNLALKTLPYGGLYVAGGIAPKMLNAIKQDNNFMKNFADKGRMQGLLEKVPVYVVTHPQVGLLGARVMCRRMLRHAVSAGQLQALPSKL